ncbi:MAG: polysulfide reductase NrfD [Candidatus Tectomicrobia bacterium]|nr:polysulfide reductase NrfD [Candidatus Tectomicrobia bacterium]
MKRLDTLSDFQIRQPFSQLWLAGGLMMAISLAVYMYSTQFMQGLGVTGLNRPVVWGVYVANFIFSVGLSAGGIGISALVHLLDKEKMKPVAIMAEVMATSFLMLAGLFIFMDLGQPTRLFYVFFYPNLRSPLLWDVIVISSYLLLCSALLYFSARAELVRRRGNDRRWQWAVRLFTLGHTSLSPAALKWDRWCLKTLAIISIPGAVALHSVTAWILGLVKGQPGWNTPILAPLFIASALVSGLAAVILAVIVGRRLFALTVEEEAIQTLARYLLFLIPVLMYLLFSEFLTMGYSGTPTHLQVFEEILWGAFSRIFWFDVIVGTLIPLVILGLPWTRTITGIAVASFMVVVGVFAERTYLLLPSLMRSAPFMSGNVAYAPSSVEWSLMTGAYALAFLIFLVVMGFIFGPRAREERPETIY